MFSLKIKYIYGFVFLLLLIELLTVNLAFAYDETQSVYGLSKVATCKDLEELKEEAKQKGLANEEEIYQKLFSAQCAGGNEEDYFKAPVDTNKKPNDQDKTCLDIQEIIISTLLKKETPTSEDTSTYSSECLESKEEETSSTEGGFVPIKLSAPLPIEGGEQIENSNKSYLFTYMVKLYRFVLGIAGIAAVIELILAGFQIALAADDTSGVENGKKRIIQTLEGIGILFCSAIILNTINPVAYNFEEKVYLMKMSPYLYAINSGASQDTFYATRDGIVNYTGKDVAATQLAPEIKAMLDVIAQEEGTYKFGNDNGYDVMFTGKTFSNYNDHPRQSITAGGLTSTAAGRYQFLTETWNTIAQKLNLKDFSPISQDLAAVDLLKQRGVYEFIKNGNIIGAINHKTCEVKDALWSNLGCEWASFPFSPWGQQKRNDQELVNEIVSLYNNRLNYYKGGSVNTNNNTGNGSNNGNTQQNGNLVIRDKLETRSFQSVDQTTNYNDAAKYFANNGGSGKKVLLLGHSYAVQLYNNQLSKDKNIDVTAAALAGSRIEFVTNTLNLINKSNGFEYLIIYTGVNDCGYNENWWKTKTKEMLNQANGKAKNYIVIGAIDYTGGQPNGSCANFTKGFNPYINKEAKSIFGNNTSFVDPNTLVSSWDKTKLHQTGDTTMTKNLYNKITTILK